MDPVLSFVEISDFKKAMVEMESPYELRFVRPRTYDHSEFRYHRAIRCHYCAGKRVPFLNIFAI